MAVHSDYVEEQDHKKPFSAVLDRSEPLVFLQKVFEFVARESDLFKSNSDVSAVFKMIRSRMEESRKNAAVQLNQTKPEQQAKEEKKRKESEKKAALRKKEEALKVKEAGTKPEEEANGPRAPNKSNGLDMDTYSWGQSLQEVNVYVHVPPGTKPSLIVCEIKKNHLKVGVKGQPPVIDGELFNSVKVDDCFWSLEDRKFLSIVLTKQDGKEWWKYVVKGEPEIDTRKAEPEPSFIADLDPETRSTVDKVMFDQRQRKMGLPTSDEMQRKEIMAKHLEMAKTN
ncbi:protein BOBBER 1-like isoform X2 [Salvia hispanica]|uniref:protein BOBBER 1-like isoform X2 n=1 Tax=Salvia hispanica TaxID=49212 RepID=UPI002009B970|nr:protein BOBBER 1-like isoform X2 [Salvia hispanica]XP_047973431.1 protein BOBBER 1-like isoform X2 [Salvia hispanica]